MDLEASLRTTAAPSAVVAHVAELDAYPKWMSLVHSATRVAGANEPTWNVELRAKVGPFARSKRLRMARTTFEEGDATRIVFERKEDDGRQHAAWRLTVTVQRGGAGVIGGDGGTHLVMRLHYDGRFFVSVVEAILQQNIDAGRKRLGELLAG
jgi:Polyketide cyclase / dehydrase and lipid transport